MAIEIDKTGNQYDVGDPHNLLNNMIQLNMDMLTIVIKSGKCPYMMQFDWVYQILLRYSHKTIQLTWHDFTAQIVVGFFEFI